MNLFALKTAAQTDVDNVAPNRVKFTLEKNEQGRNELVMRYTYTNTDGEDTFCEKFCDPTCHGADMLVTFIEQRADFLNASCEEQIECQKANVHPQYFKQWSDALKAGKSEKEIFAEVPRLITFHNISTK